MEKTAALQEEITQTEPISITPANAIFTATGGGFVSLELEGKVYDRVAIYRAFPFTEPYRFISVREFGDKAAEIGIIEDLEVFDKDTGALITAQLSLRYFLPKILKINSIRDEYGYAYFEVTTDKGDCCFTISIHDSPIVYLSERRILIRDIDGNRFEIEDIDSLSSKERKKIDIWF